MNSFIKRWGMVPPVILFMIFPLTFSFAKLGFNYGPPILFVSLRMILCGIALLGYHFFIGKKTEPFSGDDWKLFFYASIMGVALTYILEYWALKYMAVSKVTIIFLSVPFASVLFEHYHSLSKFTLRKLMGLCVGLLGILPILLQGSGTEMAFSISKYEIAMLLASASYAYGWISVKRMVEKNRHSVVYINGLCWLVG
jgi:drug/metabolite transporter (DMT)-like permease